MANVTGFPPLATASAKVLILGSMPSVKSLEKQQYYGHPRNAFWPIIGTLFGTESIASYAQKQALLAANNIAVWDVLKHCYRPGSMDTAIDQKTMECNDFLTFFSDHPRISHVFFNGGTAEKFYKKFVSPLLTENHCYLQYYRLPSTSPAYAAINLAEKTEQWRILQFTIKQ